jgi:hypothetical protein
MISPELEVLMLMPILTVFVPSKLQVQRSPPLVEATAQVSMEWLP